METAKSADQPWHAAFPAPSCTDPPAVTATELLTMMRQGKLAGRDFLLIDLRKMDHEGGTIQGSLNLPAQSVFYSLQTLILLCKSAQISTVIWYCGSSGGRGTRAAGWLDDAVKEHGHADIKSCILAGGIKGWVKGGTEYTDLMVGYDADVWKKS